MSDRRRSGQAENGRRWLVLTLIVLLAAACGTGSSDPAVEVGPGSTVTTAAISVPPATSPSDPAVGQSSTTLIGSQACTTQGDTTPSTEPTRASTTAAPTTTAPTTSAAPTTNPRVAAAQQRLTDLGYWLGSVDGQLGPMTAHAATAFQKAEGLARTGVLDDATVERLSVASTPAVRSSSGQVLEVDLDRQILLVATGGRTERIYDIATGSSATPTPVGRFEIVREIDGIRHAPLGTLYRPKYFNGGIALHGYTSVPAEPASHGCVRLTYAAMDDLWASGSAPISTPVWVY